MKMLQTSSITERLLRWLTIVCLAVIILGGVRFYWRIHAYDGLIAEASQLYEVDSRLIKAVIWKESRFNPKRVGKLGEIGLMQVTQNAAAEWASANGVDAFVQSDLFHPEVNIRAGTWYLGRAIQYWSTKDNPLPYALAEYNAGRSNTQRWASTDKGDANKFWNDITYPTTRRYVRDILMAYRGHR